MCKSIPEVFYKVKYEKNIQITNFDFTNNY